MKKGVFGNFEKFTESHMRQGLTPLDECVH